ncbi:MAG: hypothetical protein ACM3U2_11545 [Deltaproteobacteria bacterium]
MSEIVCPVCRAEIKADLVDDAGRVECPFCGHAWPLLDLPQAKCPPPELEPVTGAPPSLSGITSNVALPTIPAGSQIKVVEAADDRLVLYIPGGGKSASGLGCFAVAWNGFMCVFTTVLLGALLRGNGNDAPPMLGVVAFLGLFWAVGLGMAWFWMKMKYERTFLLLDRDRLVIQRVLFNRKRIEETHLTPDSRAALVESYQQNDKPVYRIEVQGSPRAAKFGTALADAEKDWLVDRINDFLCHGGEPASETEPAAEERPAAGIPASPLERLAPADLSPGSPIHIDEDSPDVLQFHYLLALNSPWRWLAPVFTVPFSVAWFAGIFSFIGGAWQIPFLPVRILFVVFSIPFLIAGLVPLAMGLIAVRGRTTIRLTPDSLRCRWHSGWLGYSRSLPTAAIDRLGVEAMASSPKNPRVRGVQHGGGPAVGKVCAARAAGRALYLTLFPDDAVSQQVAALLRTRLKDMGFKLPDA